MGVSNEQLFVVSRLEQVKIALTACMLKRGRECIVKKSKRAERLATRDFEKSKVRYFVLAEYSDYTCVSEFGGLFDWDLAKELSVELSKTSILFALFEPVNAWGHVTFNSIGEVFPRLFPEAAWRRNAAEEELLWHGDARKCSEEFALKKEFPNYFANYHDFEDVQYLQMEPIAVAYLGFSKVDTPIRCYEDDEPEK